MTACRNKARGAVVAALAGALTLGAAPVMALADGASLMLGDETGWIADSAITAVEDEDGTEYTGDALKDIRFENDGFAHYVVPTEITAAGADDPTEVDGTDLVVDYYQVVDSNVDHESLPDGTCVSWIGKAGAATYAKMDKAGTYYATVRAKDAAGFKNTTWIKFTIVDGTLSGAYICDGADKDDRVVDYTGSAQNVGRDFSVVIDGQVSPSGYTAEVFQANVATPLGSVTNVGNYVVRVKNVVTGETRDVPFSIAPIELEDADVDVYDSASSEVSPVAKAGAQLPSYVGAIDGNYVDSGSAADGKTTLNDETVQLSVDGVAPSVGQTGSFTYTVKVVDAQGNPSKNITGEKKLTVVRYARDAKMSYDGTSISNGGTTSDNRFSEDLIDVRDDYNKVLGFTVAYQKETTKGSDVWKDVDSTTAPGSYRAVVSVSDSTYSYGGSFYVTFDVDAVDVKTADIYVLYNGKVVKNNDTVDIYSGDDLTGNVTYRATDEDGKAVDISEFDVVIEKDGEEVDSIVDAGDYKITVKTKDGSMYAVSGNDNSVSFKVAAVDATYGWVDSGQKDDKGQTVYIYTTTGNAALRLSGTMGYGAEADATYLYTGEAVTPSFEYDLVDKALGYDKAEDWMTLPSTAYKLELQKLNEKTGAYEDVDEAVETGTYKAVLTDQGKDANHKVSGEFSFKVSDTKVFADVPNDEWYSEYVYKAASAGFGYINGYGDGTFFGPADSISRADVVKVLFNMAGKPGSDDKDEGSSDADKTFDLPYTDCDEGAYYAQALQWATKLGIVSGDGSNGGQTFRPTDTVTREELAKILYNYMALQGETEDVDVDAVLGEYEDESSVSAWAREYVAWLVEQEVMGQDSGLRGDQAISRAEVATMAVRLQPNGALKDGDFLE